MNPFEYAHDLVTKESYDEEVPDRKDYKQFLINRTLSYHNDIIHFVNEMNWILIEKMEFLMTYLVITVIRTI